MKVREALEIADRDDIGHCASCSDLALDGEKFCWSCKDYWEHDAPTLERMTSQELSILIEWENELHSPCGNPVDNRE